MTKVAVVGGGLAGIAAALQCADGGADVALFEARSRLGGATFSLERDGLRLDNGQHVFLRCCTAYLGLVERLGVAGDVVLQQRLEIPVVAPGGRVAWLRRNRLPAPFHLAGALARYRHLSARDRLAVARAARALSRLELGDPVLDERTFAEWLDAQGQSREAVEGFWNLIVLPTVNLPAQEASLALATKVFQTGLLDDAAAGDVGYAAVPLQRLHGDAAEQALAAAGVRVRLRERAEALDGLRVLAREPVEADAVVLAVPHDDAARLLGRPELAELGASPIVNLHVLYDRPVTGFSFCAGHNSPVQWVFDRTESAGAEDGQLLAISLSGARDEIGRRVEDLRARYLPALEALFPAARKASVESFFVTREPQATFRQAPGTQRLRPGPRAGVPGLFLAGAWTDTGWPATMEGAVRSGIAAARAVLAHAGRPRVEVAA